MVVFKYPGDNKTDFIKRVIGLPGDTVQMKGGRLFINGKMVEREEVGKYTIDEYTVIPTTYTEYTETLPNGKSTGYWSFPTTRAWTIRLSLRCRNDITS